MAFPVLPRTKSRIITALANLINERLYTGTNADTTGAQTINEYSGQVQIAIGAASVVVTNSLVTSSSRILATLNSTDGTLLYLKSVVPADGSFTITGNANATAATKVTFLVLS
jgi:hypothetical protein